MISENVALIRPYRNNSIFFLFNWCTWCITFKESRALRAINPTGTYPELKARSQ